jgi:replicative DNA helicase
MLAADALMVAAQRMEVPIEESIAECEIAIGNNDIKAPPMLEPKQAVNELSQDLERRHGLQGALSGLSTGFQRLDEKTEGFQMGEFWIIGARPGVGKTAIALNMAEQLSIVNAIPSLFVSLEMSSVAIGRRLVSMNAQINGGSIRKGSFTAADFGRMASFNVRYAKSSLYILNSPGGIKISRLLNAIRAAIRRWKVKVVFIDYLQKIRPDEKGEKRTYEIGDTSGRLVHLAKTENVNITALAQLNRDPDKNGKRSPVVSDLADSKSIEADADFIGLLERPIQVDGGGFDDCAARLIVAKQRDGETGIVPLSFQGWFCRFKDGTRNDPEI